MSFALLRLTNMPILLLAIVLATACGGENSNKGQETAADAGRSLDYTHEVTFLTGSGEAAGKIEVAVATEPEERNMGLMDVNNLPDDKGMLFVFEQQEPLSFWMANTPLPLDIIFVNESGEIVRIHHRTKPFSEKNYTSGKPARFVIETVGGYCQARDIKQGDRVNLPEEFTR